MDDTDGLLVKPTVLVVDDTPDNLSLMSDLLEEEYRVKIANNGEKALKVAFSADPPDIILLDIMMPVMDGYEACRHLKADSTTRDIPVIFLTAKSEVADEMKGFALGAVDYITKPISPPVVLARVKTHLELKKVRDYLRDQNDFLEDEVRKRTQEIVAVQEATILAMASLAETRDWRKSSVAIPVSVIFSTMTRPLICYSNQRLYTISARSAFLIIFFSSPVATRRKNLKS